MSWDVTMVSVRAPLPAPDDLIDTRLEPMGDREVLCGILSARLRGLLWHDAGWGLWEGGELRLEVDLGSDEPIRRIRVHAHAHGSGDAVRLLLSISEPFAWGIVDHTAGSWVDPEHPEAAGWETFTTFRDQVLGDLGIADGAPPEAVRPEAEQQPRRRWWQRG